MFLGNDIVNWAEEKGIFKRKKGESEFKSIFLVQLKGIAEETVEVTEAYTAHKHCCGLLSDVQKEMGDIYVWWINACATIGLEPEHCIEMAYRKITQREGYVNDSGRFVKDDKDRKSQDSSETGEV